MTRRPCRASALLDLLHASGVDVKGAYDVRKGIGDIPPGMLYSDSRGAVFHIPFRKGRGYIGALVPGTPEANAYIGESRDFTLPTVPYADPRYRLIWHARRALGVAEISPEKK